MSKRKWTPFSGQPVPKPHDPWDFSDKIESEILDNHETYVNELEQDNVRMAARIGELEAELGKATAEYLVKAQAYGTRIAELEEDLRQALNTTMIQNLNAEIVRLRHELLAAHERHAPECQHMQISGADKRCIDGRDRHYCDRHDDHPGTHRCECGVTWRRS